ncbi:MAG: hypothetical protein GX087_03070 [Desulfobulbaceae bacterium]|nr:hypothetical protein [Desulfobulbaceae bacterium]
MNESGSTIDHGRKFGAETHNSVVRHHYLIRFRDDGREYTACAGSAGLQRGALAMVHREQGLEPALLGYRTFAMATPAEESTACPEIVRLATEEEQHQYQQVLMQEREAFVFCQQQVEQLQLIMHLVRVERFFNGTKMIFYFTAENRVDFRELVKVLVQQYRTRIEMRQIGVRHETQMLGGLGTCGRELCCSTFLNKFDSVSIKMAKAQDLPLNPAKISGVCNRLLCCLTYEYDSYRMMKRQMPRIGRVIRIDGVSCQVLQQHPLTGSLTITGPDGKHRIVREEEWRRGEIEGGTPAGATEAPHTSTQEQSAVDETTGSANRSTRQPSRQSRRRKGTKPA